MTQGPILIDLEDAKEAPDVAKAAPVPDVVSQPEGRAMQQAVAVAARGGSRLARLGWGLALALLGAIVSVAAWDFIVGLLDRAPVLGYVVTGLVAALCLLLLIAAIRELAGFSRLRRVDHLRAAAQEAARTRDLKSARKVVDDLLRFYRSRPETAWSRERLGSRLPEVMDADTLLKAAEDDLLAPLDAAAAREVEAAARQVAAVTALVPLALADVAAALASNARMIRRVAEIYGGRSGRIGNWRLVRSVMTHLLATGIVAAGDDLVGTVLGGGAMAKISRRFGEGVVNGALTARVGVAAMEVCRPVPFSKAHKPLLQVWSKML